MSFQKSASFSMIATRESQHADRLPRLDKYKLKVLPIAAIYGGNASGKTNFFKALNFAKDLVVKGVQLDGLIPVEPFSLDEKMLTEPCRFSFELLIKEVIYEYSFAVLNTKVVEEKLVQIKSTVEKILYHRHEGKPNFDVTLKKDKALEYAFKGTRDNQLF